MAASPFYVRDHAVRDASVQLVGSQTLTDRLFPTFPSKSYSHDDQQQ